jgi:hypothetical protein
VLFAKYKVLLEGRVRSEDDFLDQGEELVGRLWLNEGELAVKGVVVLAQTAEIAVDLMSDGFCVGCAH